MRSLTFFLGLMLTGPMLADAQPLRVRVVDARTTRPISGAVVLVRLAPGAGVGVVGEAVTDSEGWFTFDRRSAGGDVELALFVYKFGYLLWSNVAIFRVPTGKQTGGGPWGPPVESRVDRGIPDTILMSPFPENGWRPTHAIYLRMIVDADGRHEERPAFWQAVQREFREAAAQCGAACD